VVGVSGTRPSSAQLHPRGLHDSGRQSSLDSGIGIATGSQSSYSGSFSSYTGSLDMASQGGEGEFGSVASLPALQTPPSSPPRHSGEYQIPSLLRLQYDTPRSLLKTLSLGEPSNHEDPPELGRYSRVSGDGRGSHGQRLSNIPTGPRTQHQATMRCSNSRGSERAPSVDSEGGSAPRPLLVPGGLVGGETQVMVFSHSVKTKQMYLCDV
uniref:Uncharacterized protein n=1 Tax=Cyclopterus lumpus TaxID=8103 RepID=A0A8C3ABG1_CYCLU